MEIFERVAGEKPIRLESARISLNLWREKLPIGPAY